MIWDFLTKPLKEEGLLGMNYHEWTSLFNIYIQKGGSFAFSISKI